ncbi:UDP-2,3-diacylglucosamine diphosphatase [Phaeocystidibacter luteus]|uniref:UDP-2,3-diacylglucosamine diphosphatase n=1 Tax=Phaeocystidibacter luteus TaxID=911197 RepID=A0A6N6RLN0_9FLAO|nr:UDP-2,3-diacylglucosamine diphosphatase [Phaeocystidibacter luteus]KAB2814478.1 UDP-2,3-diacylglucosamine diphosphatase [Phaeocystidibacter luteus]
MRKRLLETVVISDVHLGTFGCHAKELHQYLRSIKPKTLVLNGDIIDIWNFRKRYFPKSHMRVLKRLLHMASKGTEIYYLTGNHDELLRKFADYDLGNIHLRNKLVMDLDGKKAWMFHGDIFDASIQNAKWIAKLGGWGYDLLILMNRAMNFLLEKMGREKYSLSKKIKNSVKKAVKFISDFEDTAATLAVDQKYDYVICGHIHQPQMREVETKNGKTMYLNSGDWVENCTALEYNKGKWSLYQHDLSTRQQDERDSLIDASPKAILAELLKESQVIAAN